MINATFAGGPLDGDTYGIDDDAQGVLVGDAETGQAWLYARPSNLSNPFTLRLDGGADPATGARLLDENAAIAAVESGYVVIAEPGDEPTQDEIDAEEELTDGE